jgi:hypothetical protein
MDQQFLHSPDTEDGTLVNHRKLNTKNATIMWTPIIPPSKGIQSNAISKEDNGKSFATIKGVVQADVLDHGDTGIIKCYRGTLKRLRQAIHQKKPGMPCPDVIILHGNAMPHNATWTCDWVWCYGW